MNKYIKGSTIAEFIIFFPLLSLLAMMGVQFGLMYNAKMNLTYAAHEAARAGAISNATPKSIKMALLNGLIPLTMSNTMIDKYSGQKSYVGALSSIPNIKGINAENLARAAIARAGLEVEAAFVKVEIISPSAAAFNDFDNLDLKRQLGLSPSVKVIPNRDLNTPAATVIGKTSGVSLQDANVLKLRITYGYEPKIPLISSLLSKVIAFFSRPVDMFSIRLLATNRIPIVVDVSSHMLSPAYSNDLPTKEWKPDFVDYGGGALGGAVTTATNAGYTIAGATSKIDPATGNVIASGVTTLNDLYQTTTGVASLVTGAVTGVAGLANSVATGDFCN